MSRRNYFLCFISVGIAVFILSVIFQGQTQDKSKLQKKSETVGLKNEVESTPSKEKRMRNSAVEDVLENSRSKRASEGVPPIEILWYAETEKELMVWAKEINAGISARFRSKESEIIVLSGLEGSGIPRQTLYAYVKGSKEEDWALSLVLPTQNFSSVKVELDKKGTLVVTDNKKVLASVDMLISE